MGNQRNGRRFRVCWDGATLEARNLLSVTAQVQPLSRPAPLPKMPYLFIEPEAGRDPIVQAINAARHTIRLGICNLSDPGIGDALAAAVSRGVDVKVIIDRADYDNKEPERIEIAQLISQGVNVHISNSVFPQSFEKELVIDQRAVEIMTMCLVTQTFEDTRDYGLLLANRAIIREVTSVFDTDWAYSAPPGQPTPAYNPTPALHVPSLIWSPTNTIERLSGLIQSAKHSIDLTTEYIDDTYLEGQLIAAAQRGVQVRVITPTVNREGFSNVANIAFLTQHGIDVRVTPDQNPPPGAPPYMHAKTMVVDGRVGYMGSIDLATVQTSVDRELGIILRQRGLVSRIRVQFQKDWATAQLPN